MEQLLLKLAYSMIMPTNNEQLLGTNYIGGSSLQVSVHHIFPRRPAQNASQEDL